ncbi:MAG: DUF1648 domain-containing protein, partial [Verrucomicrobiota bacterium]
MTTRRLFAFWILPALLAGASFLFAWVVREELPQRIATHWDAQGKPNGAMTFPSLMGFWGMLSVSFLIGMGLLGQFSRLRFLTGLPLADAGCFASLLGMMLWANLRSESATLPPTALLLALVVSGGLWWMG